MQQAVKTDSPAPQSPPTVPAPPLSPKAHWALSAWRQIRPLLILVLIMCAVRSSLADWNDVPTGSMKPSILEGDRIFVNKLAYDLKVPFTTWHLATWGAPKQGEIVVFLSPEDGQRLVKRCIAGPGDTVQLKAGRLFVNGVESTYGPLDPKYRAALDPTERSQFKYEQETMPDGHAHPVLSMYNRYNEKATFGPITLSKGPGVDQFFMMGDNRDNSKDSRFIGPVSRDLILGRATAVAFSLDLAHHWTPRWSRSFTSLP